MNACRDAKGNTALHHAAQAGRESVVRWLVLSGGADLFAKNEAGLRAMQVAAREQQMVVMHWLVDCERGRGGSIEKPSAMSPLASPPGVGDLVVPLPQLA